MPREFTATEIAELLAAADNLRLADHTNIHNRVKYLAKREILKPSRRIDARGTLAFTGPEVFRAAVLVDLVGLAMDVRALEAVNDAATKHFIVPGGFAPSQRYDGGYVSHGGLADAVQGVAQGESWFLKVWRVNPGYPEFGYPEEIRAAFVYGEGLPMWNEQAQQAQGRKPTRVHVTVDLVECWSRLIPLVGEI